MRSRTDILADIAKHEAQIQACREEIKAIETHCPHPDIFLTMQTRDTYDNCGAPVYESTFATVSCSLCGKSRTVEYDKKRGLVPTKRIIIAN